MVQYPALLWENELRWISAFSVGGGTQEYFMVMKYSFVSKVEGRYPIVQYSNAKLICILPPSISVSKV